METKQLFTAKPIAFPADGSMFNFSQQVTGRQQHQEKVLGLLPVALPAFKGSKLVFIFTCLNDGCRKANVHRYNTRIISNLLGATMACKCGHTYRFRKGLDGKAGLFNIEGQA